VEELAVQEDLDVLAGVRQPVGGAHVGADGMGNSLDHIKKIMGRNFLRVMREVIGK